MRFDRRSLCKSLIWVQGPAGDWDLTAKSGKDFKEREGGLQIRRNHGVLDLIPPFGNGGLRFGFLLFLPVAGKQTA
jgi:hypothetical protein